MPSGWQSYLAVRFPFNTRVTPSLLASSYFDIIFYVTFKIFISYMDDFDRSIVPILLEPSFPGDASVRPSEHFLSSPWGPGRLIKSRMCPPYRYVSLKATKMGRFLRITVKRLAPCRCLDGHVKEPFEMSMEPDRKFDFFWPTVGLPTPKTFLGIFKMPVRHRTFYPLRTGPLYCTI